MNMTPGEIVRSYNQAVNKDEQITILSQLNACDPAAIVEVLRSEGAIGQSETLPERMHRVLKERGITQMELAELAGVTATNVSLYIRRKTRPSRATTERLIAALDRLEDEEKPVKPVKEEKTPPPKNTPEGITLTETEVKYLREHLEGVLPEDFADDVEDLERLYVLIGLYFKLKGGEQDE